MKRLSLSLPFSFSPMWYYFVLFLLPFFYFVFYLSFFMFLDLKAWHRILIRLSLGISIYLLFFIFFLFLSSCFLRFYNLRVICTYRTHAFVNVAFHCAFHALSTHPRPWMRFLWSSHLSLMMAGFKELVLALF